MRTSLRCVPGIGRAKRTTRTVHSPALDCQAEGCGATGCGRGVGPLLIGNPRAAGGWSQIEFVYLELVSDFGLF